MMDFHVEIKGIFSWIFPCFNPWDLILIYSEKSSSKSDPTAIEKGKKTSHLRQLKNLENHISHLWSIMETL